MSYQNHKIPEVLIPETDICVPLFIPAHTDYVALMVRAVRQLELDRHYERDENKSALIVREQWRTRTIQPLIDALIAGTPCEGENNVLCETYETYHDVIQFYPNDPYANADYPDIYLKWLRFESLTGLDGVLPEWLEAVRDAFSYDLSGYLPDDCVLVINTLSVLNPIERFEQLLENFTNFPFPTITLNVNGSGTVGLEFLNVPLGGRAIILEDIDLSIDTIYRLLTDTLSSSEEGLLASISIVELNRDLTSLPPETAATQIQEVELNNSGDHTIRIIFVPAFNDEVPLVFPFAGIRSVRICDNLKVYGTSSEGFVTKYQKRKGFIMGTSDEICAGVICAFEKIAQRILLAQDGNITNDIQIDKDLNGLVNSISIIKGAASAGDPIESTAQEAYNGGVYNQALRVKAFFDDMNQQKIDGFLASTISKLAQFAVDVLDAVNLDIALLSYVNGVEVINIDVAKLAEELYCNGDFSIGLLYYALGNHTENEINEVISITSYFLPSTFDRWYNEGTNTPRNDYISFPCYRQPSHTVTLTPDMVFNGAGGSINVDGVFPPLPNKSVGNRWNFQVSGRFVHTPTGGIFTMFYYTLDNVVWSSTSAQVRLNVGQTKPFDAIPIVNLDGTYTAYHTQGYVLGIFGLAFGAKPAWLDTDVTGSITVTKHDLGAG